MINRLQKGTSRRARNGAHWRCEEPVVVLESDDWGMTRDAIEGKGLEEYGSARIRGEEKTETLRDLEHIYNVLESYQFMEGRPTTFVANFITANPDYEAIKASGYKEYHEIPIGEMPELREKWQEGVQRRVFHAQYHGRLHFWYEHWLKDLQDDFLISRKMLDMELNGGITLFEEYGNRYHSEYVNWVDGSVRPPEELLEWVKTGHDYFVELFGFKSLSTVSPHYVFSQHATRVFSQLGIKYLQATHLQNTVDSDGNVIDTQYPLGYQSQHGVTFLARNVNFNPRPKMEHHHMEPALKQILQRFDDKVPAVVDTHRINFVASWGRSGSDQLGELLEKLKPYNPLVLSSVELGEAINNNGVFHDIWTNEERRLTPIDPPWRKALRSAHRVIEK